jgi:5-methyltetrahydrofolate--homocysteine methyltransferase
MKALLEIAEGIINGNANMVKEKVLEALNAGVQPQAILDQGLIPGLDIVGDKFKKREIFVPNLLLSARAMNIGVKVLEPFLKVDNVPSLGKVVIGTVEGDVHNIGKNLVACMLKNAGFTIVDIGEDVSKEKFVQAIQEHNPDILAMSALLTNTMQEFGEIIKALVKAGLRSKVKVMIGGAPVTLKYSSEIGADAYAVNATAAPELAKTLLKR